MNRPSALLYRMRLLAAHPDLSPRAAEHLANAIAWQAHKEVVPANPPAHSARARAMYLLSLPPPSARVAHMSSNPYHP